MQKLLALAVLGGSLAVTATAAIADGGYMQPVPQSTQSGVEAPQYVEPQSGVAGTPAQVDQSEFRENGQNNR